MVGPAATNARSAGSSSNSSPSAAGAPCRKAGIDGRESTLLPAVDHSTDRKGFRKLIDERALVFTRLPAGPARDLAARANEAVGRGDGSLHTRAEYDALFDLLAEGATTVPEAALAPYQPVLLDKDAFFAEPMYVVEVEGWPQDAPTLKGPVTAPAGARLALWPTAPHDTRPDPIPGRRGRAVLHHRVRPGQHRQPHAGRAEAVLARDADRRAGRRAVPRAGPDQPQGHVQRSLADARGAGVAARSPRPACPRPGTPTPS